jgi:hypothetical protein
VIGFDVPLHYSSAREFAEDTHTGFIVAVELETRRCLNSSLGSIDLGSGKALNVYI